MNTMDVKSYTIGVLFGNSHSPHSLGVMKGIEQAAKKFSLNVLYFQGLHTDYSFRKNSDGKSYDYQTHVVYDYSSLFRCDALIVSYGTLSIFLDDVEKNNLHAHLRSIPHVLMEAGDFHQPASRRTVINFSNREGMKAIMNHLIQEHGCRNFLYLSGPPKNADSRQREEAFKSSLIENGLDLSPDRIAHGDFSSFAQAPLCQLLDAHPDADALVCANDLMAECAVSFLRERGIIPGQDIAVTGFDDCDIAAAVNPPLTTVFQDSVLSGKTALESAYALLRGEEGRDIRLTGNLVVRASCGCPGTEGLLSPHEYMAKLKNNQSELSEFKLESWNIPLITSDMVSQIGNEKDFYAASMERLASLGAKKSFLFAFEEPILHRKQETMSLSRHLPRLAAWQSGSRVTAYEPEERPLFDQHFLTDRKFGFEGNFSIFALYSAEYQYGILAVQAEPERVDLFHLVSLVIGNGLHFNELSRKEKEMRRTLENLVKEVNEKNVLLHFLSNHDPLTGCFNRRGFFQCVTEEAGKHPGENGIFLLADLDYLKQINDLYGHAEGDFSIKLCAVTLKQVLGPDSLVGRIGGDEFAAFLPGIPDGAEEIIPELQRRFEHFNRIDEKPYYINMSIGKWPVVCSDDIDFSSILCLADQELYLAKKSKNAKISKE